MRKRNKVIETAALCFVDKGYAETNLDDVAARSGVVKQTLYNYFSNKDDLFKAAIAHLIQENKTDFDHSWLSLEPEKFFATLAEHQFKLLSDTKTTSFLHLLVKECRRFPELQHIYAESIPMPFVDFVAEYIDNQHYKDYDRKSAIPSLPSPAIAWCFRAAVTGFATLNNLGVLYPHKLPSPERYFDTVSMLFSYLIKVRSEILDLPNQEPKQRSVEDFFGKGEKQMEQKQIDCFIAAMKVFSANGYVDASVDEIALLSKTAKQTIYTYFESKNGLYAALSDAVIERLKHTQLPDSKLGLPEYLLSFISSFLETIEQECLGEYFRLILGEAKAFPQASGFLFLYLFCFGLPELSNKFKDTFAVNTEEGALLALILRNIIGGFALFNQIYVLAENPYLNQSMLSQILARLLQISEENREFFGIAAQ